MFHHVLKSFKIMCILAWITVRIDNYYPHFYICLLKKKKSVKSDVQICSHLNLSLLK